MKQGSSVVRYGAVTRMLLRLLPGMLVAGCATGPAFTAPKSPGTGRAVIYIYRASSIFGAGLTQEIRVGSQIVGRMVAGGYMRMEEAARTLQVLAPACWPEDKTTVVLVPGSVAYVQLELLGKTVQFGGRYYADYGCRLTQRSEAEALPVLRSLRRVQQE